MPPGKCGRITEKLQIFQADVLNIMSNLSYYFSLKNGENKNQSVLDGHFLK